MMNFLYFMTFLTTGLAATGAVYYAPKITKPLALHRKLTAIDNETDIRISSIPKNVWNSHVQMQLNLNSLDDEIADTVNEFIYILGSLEHVDLTNLYTNFRPYNIQAIDKNGYGYDIAKMRIEVDKNHIHDLLIMGLLYLAGSNMFYSTYASGFIRKTGEYKLGYGLTRGYVEILACRYFGVVIESMHYDMIDDFAGCIETIVGQEKMESAFFNGSLEELIEELSHYSSREEAIRTIREIDHMETALKSGYRLTCLLSSQTYKNLSTRISSMLQKKLATIDSEQKGELEFTFAVLCDFLNSLYINGPAIFKVPRKEMYKTITLAKKELENRGMSVKIE